MGGSRHKGRHGSNDANFSTAILVNFLRGHETFFGFAGFHSQANTRPASRPPSDLPVPPTWGQGRGGTTWPASSILFSSF
jgi:hypothetical protein